MSFSQFWSSGVAGAIIHRRLTTVGGMAIDISPVACGKLEAKELGGHDFAEVAYEVAVKGEVQNS